MNRTEHMCFEVFSIGKKNFVSTVIVVKIFYGKPLRRFDGYNGLRNGAGDDDDQTG